MSLQFTVENLDGVDDALKGMYQEVNGKYQLAIEGLPEDKTEEYNRRMAEMDAKVNEVLSEKKAEAEKRRLAEVAARKEAEDAARKSGDLDTLEKSWAEKYANREKELRGELEPKLEATQRMLEKSTVSATATRIAAKIGIPSSQGLLAESIKKRLGMAVKNDEAVTVVLDKNGKPSALTLAELEQEFVSDSEHAPLIIGSKASGGGASESNGGAGSNTIKRAEFDKKSAAERHAFIKGGGKLID